MTTPSTLLIAAAVGAASGTHAAIWGMYKDAVHEGFGAARFSRSIIVGTLVGMALQLWFSLALPAPGAIVLLFALAYAAERGLIEVWKTFLREEDQSKYFIPMQFAVRGVPITRRGPRLAAGAAYVSVVALALAALAQIPPAYGTRRTLTAAAVGLAVGIIVAIGGAWKDAPREGFDLPKFFRSPGFTLTFALLLSTLTESWLQVAAGAIGLERAAAETYKTFFFPSKPRGKFNGKPILHPHMLVRRRYFVPAYAAISIGLLACLAMTL